MKVLFNLMVTQPVGHVKRHGGGIYGEIVFRRIVERGLPISCCYNKSKWINPEIEEIIEKAKIETFDCSNQSINEIVRKNGFSLVYSPLFIGLDNFRECKLICTIHGLRDVETPYDSYFFKYKHSPKDLIKFLMGKYCKCLWRKYMSKGYHIAAEKKNMTFVTVSNHSRAGFITYFPELFKDTDIPVYYSPSTITGTIINERKYDFKYFLLVSGKLWTKNNLRAIMAFDRLFSSNIISNHKVIITGLGNPSNIKYKIKNPDKFIIKDYVSDEELRQLFHDAYSLVYPSINEGFGYPPVEAMSYGIPVLASPFTSIPEICQDAALYFNPYSIEEIMNRIILITEETRHNDYSKRAKLQYERVHRRQIADLDGLIDYIYSSR